MREEVGEPKHPRRRRSTHEGEKEQGPLVPARSSDGGSVHDQYGQHALRAALDGKERGGTAELLAAILAFDAAGLGAFSNDTLSSNQAMAAIAGAALGEQRPELAAMREAFREAARSASPGCSESEEQLRHGAADTFTELADGLGATTFASGLSQSSSINARYGQHESANSLSEGDDTVTGPRMLASDAPSSARSGATSSSDADLAAGREALGVHDDDFSTYRPETDGRHKGAVEIGIDPDADDSQDAFYLLYQGKDAKHFHWLQFVWAEVIGQTTDGAWVSCPGVLFDTSATGHYRSAPGGTLTRPGTPQTMYQTAHDGGHPWKDRNKGAGVREGETTGAVDRPQFGLASAKAAVAEHNLTAIKLRKHYEVFLVKNERHIASHSTITMDWATQQTPNGGDSLPGRPEVEVTLTTHSVPSTLPEPFRSALHRYFETDL